MAANKFATMVHRNTNKITLVLVYAFLEWVLIFLLLLNSIFSYLIIKFADYFGLKRPCLWCSRLDHIFEPSKFQNSYRSLVCEVHAAEISKLGYCSDHRKLADSRGMCEDCSSSSSSSSSSHTDWSKKFAYFPWMKKLGVVRGCGGGDVVKVCENGEVGLKCSCCGVGLDSKLRILDFEPSWGDTDYTQKGSEIDGDHVVDDFHFDAKRSELVSDGCEEQSSHESRGIEVENREEEDAEDNCLPTVPSFVLEEAVPENGENADMVIVEEKESVKKENLSVTVDHSSSDEKAMAVEEADLSGTDINQPQHLEFFIDQEDCHLIPVEFLEFGTEGKHIPKSYIKGEEENSGNGDFVLEFDKSAGTQFEVVAEDSNELEEIDRHVGTHYELVVESSTGLEEKVPLLPVDEVLVEDNKVEVPESRGLVEDDSNSVEQPGLDVEVEDEFGEFAAVQASPDPASDSNVVQETSVAAGEEMEADSNQVSEEVSQMQNEEIEADVSIGTEIPDHEPIDDIQPQEVCPSYPCIQEDPSTSNASYHDYEYEYDVHGAKHVKEDVIEFRTVNVETSEPLTSNHLAFCSESYEIEEDRVPDTPTSVDSFHHVHKKLLLPDRRESGMEESLDGSIISDIEGGDGVLTMEKLKSALRAERKALNGLYAELEEERSASAVAASQTMAMINRLQEEKAAMQMEALQYQRMMDEQSEYDQEALQLLNELMVKREKEKAELEKELEVYRKKVQDYEAKEKMLLLKRMKEGSTRSGTCSASCSNADDSDGLSIDLNHEAKDEDDINGRHENGNQNTPPDAVLYLEESLADFEEERLSILEQLKILEEKLVMLSDEEEEDHFKDIKPVEHLHEENGNGYPENFENGSEANGVANGYHYKELNGKHHPERKTLGAKAKRLLPLFDDAIDGEAENGAINGHEEMIESVTLERSKLTIEEEVDHVYERLQALEADREFLKHCIGSLKKGDKGLELLQEILHHLRDLRSVEIRARNIGDIAV